MHRSMVGWMMANVKRHMVFSPFPTPGIRTPTGMVRDWVLAPMRADLDIPVLGTRAPDTHL